MCQDSKCIVRTFQPFLGLVIQKQIVSPLLVRYWRITDEAYVSANEKALGNGANRGVCIHLIKNVYVCIYMLVNVCVHLVHII